MSIVTETQTRSNSRKAPHRKSNRSKRQPQGEWLVRGVLPRVGVAMVLGAPSRIACGELTCHLGVALYLEGCVAEGEPFGDTPAQRGLTVVRDRGMFRRLDCCDDLDPPVALLSLTEPGDLRDALKDEGVTTARELAEKRQCCVLLVGEAGNGDERMLDRIPDVIIRVAPPREPFAGEIKVDGDPRRWLYTLDELGIINKVWEYATSARRAGR